MADPGYWRKTGFRSRAIRVVSIGAPMFLSLILFRLTRQGYVWSPALDFEDRVVFSTLIPGAQY
jgi:hypothetical protein